MTVMLAATLLLSVLIGISLGLLGGGGSILTVPILTYVAGLEPQQAISTSLFVVGVTSLFSAGTHARKGRVKWKTGFLFGSAGMAGAFAGGTVGNLIPGTVLMVAFAAMMLTTSAAMIRGRRGRTTTEQTQDMPIAKTLGAGVAVGLLTGLVGAGGGFLIVPALALLGGLPMATAVATSLLVIAMNSMAGFAGHLTSLQINWPLTLGVTAAAIIGSLIGARLAGRIPETALRRGFGIFVLAMGLFVLMQELPPPANLAVGITAAALAAAAALCRFAIPACPLRKSLASPAPTETR
ncbi:sulfite exporter TauE/SafE family protein [Arthrobacter rhombi]|uniref:sulfite exporter TauE/SafE family protein n=1 Tax=Arthrobacter rhombi TaxID=71253 RepID=UPI0031DE75B4